MLAVTFSTFTLSAQENPARLDSIVPLLDPAKKDTTQLTMLIWACESWTTSPNAYPYLERLDALSTELLAHDHPRVKARARHARGAYHFFTGYHAKFERNVPLALSSFQQAVRDFEEGGHQHAVGECLDALGLVYGLAGAKDKAEQAFRDELRIGRAIGHHFLQNQALVHLAGIHADRGEYDFAWTCLDSCVRGTPGDSCLVLNERARIRGIQERRADAMALLERSLQVAGRSSNAWDSLPAITPLIRLHYAEGQHGTGLSMAMTCARLAERMGDATAQCGCINLVGDGYRFSGDPLNAAKWYEQGLAWAERIGNVGVARELGDEGSMLYAADGLREAYKLQGRTADALRMTERWAMLKDSVQRMNGREDVLRLRFLEESRRDSLVQAATAQADAAEEHQRRATERFRLYVIIGICAAAIAVAFAFWSRFRYARRANAAILKAQKEVVSSEKRREAEEVRTRIARDVHDQLGSDLTKLSMLGSEVHASVKGDPDAVPALAASIERIASEATRSLSDIVWAVDTANDTLSGLMDRSRLYCERMLMNSGIDHTIDCVVEGRDRSIDPATRRDLYLILREAVNNAVKYAEAHCIHVVFTARESKVRLHVKDDGKGFNLVHAMRRGNGLRNLKERAERLGGRLVIASEPEGGTLVRLEVDLESGQQRQRH